jgi:dihydrofolate reductase
MKAIVVAMDKNRVIGRDGKIPWHLPNDLKHFRELTIGHVVIMGRKTFESIGKPLPGRVNVVLTRQKNYALPGIVVHHSLEDALSVFADSEKIFIIGGAEIYREALPLVNRLYVTLVMNEFVGDTYFPEIDKKTWDLIIFRPIGADDKNPFIHWFMKYNRK